MTLIHVHVVEYMLEEASDAELFGCLQIAYDRYMAKYPLSPPESGARPLFLFIHFGLSDRLLCHRVRYQQHQLSDNAS